MVCGTLCERRKDRDAHGQGSCGREGVLVHGASAAQLALTVGVLDELQIHLIPVLLGKGRLLFKNMPPDRIELELLRALDGPGVLHLRYRVRSAG